MREAVGDRWAMSISQNNLGMIALLPDRFADARAHIDESVRLATEVGDPWVVAVGRHNNGNACRGFGDHDGSGAEFGAALQVYLDHEDHWSLALLIEDVALLAASIDDAPLPLNLVGAADQLRAELDAPRAPAAAQALDDALAPLRAELGADAVVAQAHGAALDASGRTQLCHDFLAKFGGTDNTSPSS